MNSECKTLAGWMKESNSTVILTGAGMSTESGVPDFRSKSGWWKKIDPTTVATIEALEENYPLFHEFYSRRVTSLSEYQPHKGHQIIAEWEQKGIITEVATQNVDGFHQQAGSQHVDELHGSIHTFRCNHCSQSFSKQDFLTGNACAGCGGKVRPNVVLFGEMLPQKSWERALNAIEKADLVIAIGTSLRVHPVNVLPGMTRGRTAIINREPVESIHSFDLHIQGSAKEMLENIDQEIEK